jgi:hypothetical protein
MSITTYQGWDKIVLADTKVIDSLADLQACADTSAAIARLSKRWAQRGVGKCVIDVTSKTGSPAADWYLETGHDTGDGTKDYAPVPNTTKPMSNPSAGKYVIDFEVAAPFTKIRLNADESTAFDGSNKLTVNIALHMPHPVR